MPLECEICGNVLVRGCCPEGHDQPCQCGAMLDHEGNCPNGCSLETDNETDEEFDEEEVEEKIEQSIEDGVCIFCGADLDIEENRCPGGCFENMRNRCS